MMIGVLHIISKSKAKIDLNETLDDLIYSNETYSHFDFVRKCSISKEETFKQFVRILEPSSSKKNGKIKFKRCYEYNGDRKWLQEEFIYFDGWLLDMDYFLEACVFDNEKPKTFYYQGAIDYHI